MRKKIREPSNVVTVWSHVMLILPNLIIKFLNVRKKKKRMPPNVRKKYKGILVIFYVSRYFRSYFRDRRAHV